MARPVLNVLRFVPQEDGRISTKTEQFTERIEITERVLKSWIMPWMECGLDHPIQTGGSFSFVNGGCILSVPVSAAHASVVKLTL